MEANPVRNAPSNARSLISANSKPDYYFQHGIFCGFKQLSTDEINTQTQNSTIKKNL